MYQPNDTILYGSYGVCTIQGFTKKMIDGKEMEYYVLKPFDNENSTFYVPKNNARAVEKMRDILSAQEIHALIESITEESPIWIERENERKEKYRDILMKADRSELIQMIKALYQHQSTQEEIGKKLHLTDERFLKDAQKLLHEEFALVLDISFDEVLPFILNEIEVKEKENITIS